MMDAASWADFRQRMPQLHESEGVWEGWRRYYDATTHQHRSRLLCRVIDDQGPPPYQQINPY